MGPGSIGRCRRTPAPQVKPLVRKLGPGFLGVHLRKLKPTEEDEHYCRRKLGPLSWWYNTVHHVPWHATGMCGAWGGLRAFSANFAIDKIEEREIPHPMIQSAARFGAPNLSYGHFSHPAGPGRGKFSSRKTPKMTINCDFPGPVGVRRGWGPEERVLWAPSHDPPARDGGEGPLTRVQGTRRPCHTAGGTFGSAGGAVPRERALRFIAFPLPRPPSGPAGGRLRRRVSANRRR